MFNLINIGERAGSGIPNIYSVWKKSGWEAPIITESFSPDRIQFSLAIKKIGDKKTAIKIGDKKSAIKNHNKELIIDFLTRNVSAKASEIAEILDLKPSRTRDYLSELIADGVIVAEGNNRNRTYKLRERA